MDEFLRTGKMQITMTHHIYFYILDVNLLDLIKRRLLEFCCNGGIGTHATETNNNI